MFTRLAYAELGVQPPPGDLYAIPGLEDYRSGVKLAMNSFLFDGGRRESWPTAMSIGIGNDRNASSDEQLKLDAVLPEGWTVKRTRDAILHVHPSLELAWGRRLGFRLMFRESEIMMDVLKELMRRNVPGLSIHDAIIVPRSARLVAKQIMGQCAYAHTGSHFPVTDKT